MHSFNYIEFIVLYNFRFAEDTSTLGVLQALHSPGGCIVEDVFWHECFPETGKPLIREGHSLTKELLCRGGYTHLHLQFQH